MEELPPLGHGEYGGRRKSRIKGCRHKCRLPGHICPQCGHFPGASAGVKTGRKTGAWGQESQKRQRFKEFIGVKPQKEAQNEQ